MKNCIKKFLKTFTLILLSTFVILALLLGLVSCEDVSYYKNTNWNCTNEEFEELYLQFYLDKIDELKEIYGIQCLEIVEYPFESAMNVYLYNDCFTADIFFANRNDYGDCMLHLYFYNESDISLQEMYDEQSKYVGFLNDLVNFVAYDAKTEENRFESLYNECISQNSRYAVDNIHFDELIGYVRYAVYLNETGNGYYYKMQKDKTITVPSNRFVFEGLLKPLI